MSGWGVVGCGWLHEHSVALCIPAPPTGWRAGPAHTHDSQLGATALGGRPLQAVLQAEVDAIVLKLDASDDEGSDRAVLSPLDAVLFQQWLGLQVRLLLPEPAHVAEVIRVALYFHHGAPFLGHETRVLPDSGTSASCGHQGQDQIPLGDFQTASLPMGGADSRISLPCLSLLLKVWDSHKAEMWELSRMGDHRPKHWTQPLLNCTLFPPFDIPLEGPWNFLIYFHVYNSLIQASPSGAWRPIG